MWVPLYHSLIILSFFTALSWVQNSIKSWFIKGKGFWLSLWINTFIFSWLLFMLEKLFDKAFMKLKTSFKDLWNIIYLHRDEKINNDYKKKEKETLILVKMISGYLQMMMILSEFNFICESLEPQVPLVSSAPSPLEVLPLAGPLVSYLCDESMQVLMKKIYIQDYEIRSGFEKKYHSLDITGLNKI